MEQDSDLKGIWVTLSAILAFLAVLVAFFFISAIAGMIVLLAAVVLVTLFVIRWIRANELD